MKKNLTAILALVLICTSCKKEAGPQGPAGKDGNANVISTNTLTLSSLNFTAGINWWDTAISAPGITSDVKDKGAVLVYRQYGTSWVPLPETDGNQNTTYEIYTGGVTLYNFNDDGTAPADPAGMVVRLVIIPASQMKAYHEQLNK